MGTHSALNGKENVAVMQFMENESLKLAKQKNFSGILTTNTSPLTQVNKLIYFLLFQLINVLFQQLGSIVYGYKTLLDYQVNKYELEDGTRPFGKAPDSQRAIVHWKEI